MTGIVLALARIAGETAPLLFTSFNNRFFTTDLTQPISSLTVQVFTYAISPYEDWHRQAWAGALVLVSIVLPLFAARALRHGADGAHASGRLGRSRGTGEPGNRELRDRQNRRTRELVNGESWNQARTVWVRIAGSLTGAHT